MSAANSLCTAARTIRRAIKAGRFDTCRRAAGAVWANAGVALPVPQSNDPGIWENVARVLDSRAGIIRAHRIAEQRGIYLPR